MEDNCYYLQCDGEISNYIIISNLKTFIKKIKNLKLIKTHIIM